jgi:tetratricopeptide (TPR) repeat protein
LTNVPRSAASIIVTTNSWAAARPCLDRIRNRLGVNDEVIVAIGDEFGATSADTARAYQWAQVVVGDPATVLDDAVAAARHDLIVFLHPALVPTGHWLDALLRPFADPTVAAVGPRFGGVGGPQGVEVPKALTADARRQFARDWAAQHRGEFSFAPTLDRACLAVTRAGLFTGGRLLVADDAFLDLIVAEAPATAAERTTPLVSACLIVRDEADKLGECITSVQGLVDEVVVYDTGSVDQTVAVARSYGAIVGEGTWVDDFGAARNAALELCSGEWILWIDADETLAGDPAGFRAALASDPAADLISLVTDHVNGADGLVRFSSKAAKVFRRERAWWQGRLHEQIVPRPGQRELRKGFSPDVLLIHTGFGDDVMAEKNKAERNIRLAEAELADGTDRVSQVLTNLARSLATAGRTDDALARFEEALAVTEDAFERRLALREGAEALLEAGRAEEAQRWIARLRTESKRHDMADYLNAIALTELGDYDGALDSLANLVIVQDDDGFVLPSHALRLRRARILREAKRWGETADELFAAVSEQTAPPWDMLAEAVHAAQRDADEVARVIPAAQLTAALRQLVAAEPEAADGVIDALFHRWQGDATVLAAAGLVAPHLSVARALEWSARLRAAGAGSECPLAAIGDDPARSVADRLQAACLLAGGFGDPRAAVIARRVAGLVPEADLVAALVQMGELAAELLPEFVVAAATDAARGVAVARALHALGATEQAEALLELTGGDAAVLLTI